METLDDLTLVQVFQNQPELRNEAFHELIVARRTGLLQTFFRRRGANPAGIDDLVQLVFLCLYTRALDGFRLPLELTLPLEFDRARAIFTPWLCTVARSVLLDVLRKEQAEASKLRRLGERAGFRETSSEPDPAEGVLATEELASLARVLDRLPTDVGNLLRAYYLEQQTLQQLAFSLSVSISTVSRRLTEACALARTLLDPKG